MNLVRGPKFCCIRPTVTQFSAQIFLRLDDRVLPYRHTQPSLDSVGFAPLDQQNRSLRPEHPKSIARTRSFCVMHCGRDFPLSLHDSIGPLCISAPERTSSHLGSRGAGHCGTAAAAVWSSPGVCGTIINGARAYAAPHTHQTPCRPTHWLTDGDLPGPPPAKAWAPTATALGAQGLVAAKAGGRVGGLERPSSPLIA